VHWSILKIFSNTSQFDVAHKTDNCRQYASQFSGKLLAVSYICANIGNVIVSRELPASGPIQCDIP